jgi:hypothetical protein
VSTLFYSPPPPPVEEQQEEVEADDDRDMLGLGEEEFSTSRSLSPFKEDEDEGLTSFTGGEGQYHEKACLPGSYVRNNEYNS